MFLFFHTVEIDFGGDIYLRILCRALSTFSSIISPLAPRTISGYYGSVESLAGS
jgi:hypothetical protein